MSAFMTQARARALRPTVSLPRPRLTIVPKIAARAPRVPFVVLVVSILAAGLIGLLLVNTALQRGAFRVSALQSQADGLTLQQQSLEVEVAQLQQPGHLASAAVRLGMVQDNSPAFLSLATGKVIGVPAPGVAGNTVNLGMPPTSALDHLSKVPPVTGGQANGQSTGVVTHRAIRPATPGTAQKNGTNQRDTHRTSRRTPARTGRTVPSPNGGQQHTSPKRHPPTH
ncbi:MAG: hypothetical protein ACR2KG_00465 [Nocardioidaceae bacterium]